MEKIYNKNVNSVNNIVAIIEKHSMRCSCGGLAVPESVQGYYYKCLSCDKSYEGASYYFTRLLPYYAKFESSSPALDNQLNCFNQAINILHTNSRTLTIPNNPLAKLWQKIKY